MSWMDDGGFEMQAFTTQGGRKMAVMNISTPTGRLYCTCTKTDVQRIRRECNRILKELEADK